MPSLLKNTVIYTIGRMFPQMANFILLPLYTRYLSTDGYGIVESMLVFGMILSIFLSMASERSMFRLYYDYGSIKGRMYFVGNVFLLILMSSTFFTVGLFLFDDYVTIIYESIEFNPYYVYTIVSSFCLSYSFIPMTLFQVEGKAINFIFLNIGIFLLNTAFIVFFVVIEEQGSEGYLKGKMIASIILLPVFLWIIFKRSIVKFKFEVLKNILSFSIPMIPVLIMAWVLNMSNRIFIEQYYSLEEVGVFSLAFKIASLGSIILAALFTSYNPVFYKIANEKGVRDAKPELKKVNNVIIIAVFAVLGVIAFLSEELIMVVFDSRYHLAGKLIPVLLLSVLFVQLTGLLNLMIYQQKKNIFGNNCICCWSIYECRFEFYTCSQLWNVGSCICKCFNVIFYVFAGVYFRYKSILYPNAYF